MSFDHFARLATEQTCPKEHALEAFGLASGFVDWCTTWFAVNALRAAECEARLDREQDKDRKKDLEQEKRGYEPAKNEARRRYIEGAVQRPLELPQGLRLDPWPPRLLHRSWLAIEVEFELLTPWYSRDDRLFHVLDNPVRKDRGFGVTYMSAASWKGLLRWACRMQAGLQGHLQRHGGKMNDWSDPDWVIHLFGNEKGEENDFLRGALAFYPTWFNKVGFEVINPHSRKTRAGTKPIFYEVVPPGTEGLLRLLYAPLPGAVQRDGVKPADALQKLLDAAEQILTVYGFSAKRTAGWGIAEVIGARANGGEWKQENPLQGLKDQLATLLPSEVDQR